MRRGELATGPSDPSANVLGLLEISPRQIEPRIEVIADDESSRHQDNSEECVERHRGDEETQFPDVGERPGRGVHTDDETVEHHASDEEVSVHELMASMEGHELAERG